MMGLSGDGVNRSRSAGGPSAGGPSAGRLSAMVGMAGVIAVIAILGATGAFSVGFNSTLDSFNISPDLVYLNWTNDYKINISLSKALQLSLVSVTVDNITTNIDGNYSQRDVFPDSVPAYDLRYWQSNYCFHSTDSQKDSPLTIINGSGLYTNLTNLSSSSHTYVTLVYDVVCPPGRYWGNITLINTTVEDNSTDRINNLTVQIDVPISTTNELNSTTGVGAFKGIFPANAGTYHYYYFNTSSVTNATALTINLSWNQSSDDLDLFLFDNTSSLMAKSIEEAGNESLYYAHLPKDEIWEIRVYGNLTTTESYTGSVYFSKLNASEDYDPDSLADLLDFGSMNVSQRTEKNITLKNGGGSVLSSVAEYIELYHLNSFASNESVESENFTFVLPSSATKLRVSVNWSGGSDYNITLYNPSGTVRGTATNKSAIANKTGAVQEEFVEIVSGLSEGVWTVNVRNDTSVSLNPYNAIVKYWVAAGNWVGTNHSTVTLNGTGLVNDSRAVHVNLTVQNITVSGVYEGFLKYMAGTGTSLRIPLRVNVSVPVLMANNTFSAVSDVMEDNYGFNRTRTINFTIQNRGNANLTSITSTNSSDRLYYGSSRINFTFQYPTWIDPYSSSMVNVTLDINTGDTGNAAGLYRGWIYLVDIDSRPYQGVNLSITFNLSSELDVVVESVTAPSGLARIDVTNVTRNITVKLNVYYLNGTKITNDSLPNLGNFSVRLEETNISSHRVPSSGNLTLGLGMGSNYVWSEANNAYYVNATVPANMTGGRYYVNVTVLYNANNRGFIGKTAYNSLGISRPGLYVSLDDTSKTINEGADSEPINLSAINYGIVGSLDRIGLDISGDSDDCASVTFERPNDAYNDYDDDRGGSLDFDEAEWDDIMINGNGSLGWYRWVLHSGNVSSTRTCTMTVNSSNPLLNSESFSLTIRDVNDDDDDGDDSSSSTTTAVDDDTTTAVYNYSVAITSYADEFNVVLGGSNSTNLTVKNTGDMSTEIRLSVSINDGITATVSPSSYYIPMGKSRNFTITFNVSESATLGEHSGTYKAYVALETAKYDTESFVFNVLSTSEREHDINESYFNYSLIYDELLANFTSIKQSGLLPVENLTAVEILLNDTLETLQSIKSAIESGDYAEAESLLAEMNSNINRVKAGLETLETGKQQAAEIAAGSLWVWVVVGVIIAAVAGLFVYMMLPVEGGFAFKQGYGRGPAPIGAWRKQRSLKDNIKEFLNKLFRRKKENKVKVAVKKYAGGYNKHRPVEYKFKKK